MEPHIHNKKEISQKDVNKVFTKMNDTNKSLVKILGIGKFHGQEKRAMNNVHMSSKSQLPVINGLHKDHKDGNKKRPVVNGNIGPVSNSSNLVSDALEPFVDELRETIEKENTCKSTEELISHFLKFNDKPNSKDSDEKKKFIASMDVVSLFPSLKSEQCADAVRKMIKSSKLELKCHDFKEMGVFLRKNMTTKEIQNQKLQHFIPSKNKTTKESKSKKSESNQYDTWSFPTEDPTNQQMKCLWAETLAVATKLVMNNHIFMFDGQIYIQENEGGTGVRLTGILAEVVMIFWTEELSKRLTKIGVVNELISRFVDDMTILPTVIPAGWKVVDNKLVFDEDSVETDMTVEDDARTMKVIQEIANDISDEIQVTFDVPSNYADKKVPILDLKAGLDSNGKIEFVFYKKPVATKLVTLKSSAHSVKQKMSTLTQQCFMRLHNTSENASEITKVTVLNEFMQELYSSGYSQYDRLTILKGGINTYKKLKRLEQCQVRPFYRPNSFQKAERRTQKLKKKNT